MRKVFRITFVHSSSYRKSFFIEAINGVIALEKAYTLVEDPYSAKLAKTKIDKLFDVDKLIQA